MSRRDDLIALRDAVQAGETPTSDLVWNALSEQNHISVSGLHVLPAFGGSVDAALALLAAVLPRWSVNQLWQLRDHTNGMKPTGQWECLLFAALEDRFSHASAKAETPARALLLATLNALIAESDT